MALRLLLVGMVATLGLDLPTGWRVDTWTCTGRSWFESRKAEWQELTATTPVTIDEEFDEPPVTARPILGPDRVDGLVSAPKRANPIEVVEKPAFVDESRTPESATLGATPTVVNEEPKLMHVPAAQGIVTRSVTPRVLAEEPKLVDVPAATDRAIVTVKPSLPTAAAAVVGDEAFASIVDRLVVSFAAPPDEPSKHVLVASQQPAPVANDVQVNTFEAVVDEMLTLEEPSTQSLVASQQPAPTPTNAQDESFKAVMDQMVAGFVTPGMEAPKATSLATALPEPDDDEDEIDLEIVAALTSNRDARPAVAPAAPAAIDPAPAPDASEWIGVSTTEAPLATEHDASRIAEPKSSARNERLVAAVRLTGEAVHAWVSLLDQTPAAVAVQH